MNKSADRLRAAHPGFFNALEEEGAARPDAHIRKLDIGKQGQLSAELTVAGQQHWVTWNGAGLSELAPGQDRKVPLGKMLRKNGAPHHLRVLSYRPGRRLTLLDESAPTPRILKGFRKNRFKGIIGRYEQARKAWPDQGIRTPDIMEVDHKRCCIIMAYNSGKPLQLSTESMDDFHLIGECLAGFQAEVPNTPLETWHIEDELDLLDRQSDRQTLFGLAPPDDWLQLRERLESAWPSLPEAQTGLCHRDLHDKQFIQNGHDLTLLDFDLLCQADSSLDPANMLAHMRLRQLQGRQDATLASTDVCGKRLLEGLAHNGQSGFWERLRFYQATTFARLALLYTLRPNWTDLAPDLAVMGHRCLDDLQRVRMS